MDEWADGHHTIMIMAATACCVQALRDLHEGCFGVLSL
jgi:hypothetical protein